MTRYFILSKRINVDISNNDENQIIVIEPRNVNLLPRVHLGYHINHGLFENNLIKFSFHTEFLSL